MRGRSMRVLGALLRCQGVALCTVLLSCSVTPPVIHETAPSDAQEMPPNYIIVCIIHGDGGYLYHDSDGTKHRADVEALAGAMRVAERNPEAEVFIFHEKRRRHFLLLFPRRDGAFYYYRNGSLLAEESYWRDHGQSRFDPEVELYDRYHSKVGSQPVRLFLYFGHEIAEVGGTGYDASHSKRAFVVQDLVDGLERFTADTTKFDLVVLSTCYNGTPHTISALAPHARYIMASPGNLHRSYFDLRSFEALDARLRDADVSAFAKKCARESFDRLAVDMQTEITVAVYDTERAQGYLRSVDSVYAQTLAALNDEARVSIEHCDCAEYPDFVRPGMSEGVDLYFRPARFGRSAHKPNHSGWECLQLPKVKE